MSYTQSTRKVNRQHIAALEGILYGVAVGDALGFPAQFEPRSARKKCPVVGMGQYMNEAGEILCWSESLTGLWSDDTSLTLCLAESLGEGFDLKDQAEKFLAWLDEGYLSARERAFDVGIQTTRALSQVRNILSSGAYDRLEQLAGMADEQSNGNGSLMRILPLVFHVKDLDPMLQFELIRKAGALTHPHIRAALCCFYYLKMAESALGNPDIRSAYLRARQATQNLMESLKCERAEFHALHRLLHLDLATLEETEIDSGGYVVSSLEASIWCLLNTDSFPDAVLKAVNLGDDADTTGAITGGLAALFYGKEAIPKEWIARLKKPQVFEHLMARTT